MRKLITIVEGYNRLRVLCEKLSTTHQSKLSVPRKKAQCDALPLSLMSHSQEVASSQAVVLDTGEITC